MTNDTDFTWFANLLDEAEVPKDGILSRPILKNDTLQVTLFAMAQGAEMSEHTTSMEAIVHFLQGEADVTFADREEKAGPGAWLRMAPRLPHSINAPNGPVVFLLILLRN